MAENGHGGTTGIYLVVDTNFLLSHLEIIERLVIIQSGQPYYTIIIPRQVLQELDGLKSSINNNEVAIQARSSIDYLYSKFHDVSPEIRSQRIREQINSNVTKDESILDCCLYFQSSINSNSMVVLLSNDKNLCNLALAENILTVSWRDGMSGDIIAEKVIEEYQQRGINNNYNGINNFNDNDDDNDMIEVDLDNNDWISNSVGNEEAQELLYESDENNNIKNMDTTYTDDIQSKHSEFIENDYKSISPAESKSIYKFMRARDEIYSQMTTLIKESITYAVKFVYGDDFELISYKESDLRSLKDAAYFIKKMGHSTFSDFFPRRGGPLDTLRDKESVIKYSSKPKRI
ncbi:mRNA-processing endoribonuclease [Martiniozyma asiatica (nom. inval.)]|nr:mRNA-processing endoribonuclease [Martiniozyma asiatica]